MFSCNSMNKCDNHTEDTSPLFFPSSSKTFFLYIHKARGESLSQDAKPKTKKSNSQVKVTSTSQVKKTSSISKREMMRRAAIIWSFNFYVCTAWWGRGDGPGWLLRRARLYMRLWICSTLLQDGQMCSTSLQESTQNGIRQQGQILCKGIKINVTLEQQYHE